ncbi:hypothetical protein Cma02nite_16870 [Cellulomonas marina]|uniref:Ribosomal protein S18 acetylase RimI n=2 Tax=Cellulomonas marina TaxID=988821 RepID=A0A1I0WAH6_9CELL|nr:hypothetical protein Cma02nite_16870 [Cellulomonas marina]SFA85278.1 Ribosomal protein S18 acetylase RimI [Cellulomonas marina]
MTVDDATGVARVNVASWHESYSHVVRPEVLAAMDVERAAAGFVAMLGGTSAITPTAAVVAESAGELVGFAVARPSQDQPPVREVELWAIYVLAAAHGTGAGQALLDAALHDAPASLWVWQDNPRAHAFYARNGFAPDGARRVHQPWGPAPIVRLVR